MSQIENLRYQYQYDVESFEFGELHNMRVAEFHPEFGLLWPLNWLENTTDEIQERWSHFMEGQTFCELGFYERDVRRFLASFPVTYEELPEKPETD